MPYEYVRRPSGLGWSELPWYDIRGFCTGRRSRPVCFTRSDADQGAIAANGCAPNWETPSECTTRGGPGGVSPQPGHVYCCPAGRPIPLPTSDEMPEMAREREAALRRIAEEHPEEPAVDEPKPVPGRGPRGEEEFTGTKASSWQWTAFGIVGLTAAAVLGWIYYTGRRRPSPRRERALPGYSPWMLDERWER